jgi:hypothetical protein
MKRRLHGTRRPVARCRDVRVAILALIAHLVQLPDVSQIEPIAQHLGPV